eukprot:SAG31_NODE_516_length_14707_cov_3.026629_6_plen_2958_part_00
MWEHDFGRAISVEGSATEAAPTKSQANATSNSWQNSAAPAHIDGAGGPDEAVPTGDQSNAVEYRTWCNQTHKLLRMGDGDWYHQIGSSYDLCKAAFEQLCSEKQHAYVQVAAPEDLGAEMSECGYRASGGNGENPEPWPPQMGGPTAPQPTPDSWAIRAVAGQFAFALTDFQVSYGQISLVDGVGGSEHEEPYREPDRRGNPATFFAVEQERHLDTELAGFLVRIGALRLGVRAGFEDGQSEANQRSADWDALTPQRSEEHVAPPTEYHRFDPWTLEGYSEPRPEWEPSASSRHVGMLEHFSFHLLGGKDCGPTPTCKYREEGDWTCYTTRKHDPHYEDDDELSNVRSPLILLNSSFELFSKGALPAPGAIDFIKCSQSSLRVKLSTQDAAIMSRFVSRILSYLTNCDGCLQHGTIPLRPRVAGFSAYKMTLTAMERWHYAYRCIVHAMRAEQHLVTWEQLWYHCELRRSYLSCWKKCIRHTAAAKAQRGDKQLKAELQSELDGMLLEAREIESELEYDQTIMYRRWALMQVIAEDEVSARPRWAILHSRARLLKLLSVANAWELDFGWMQPGAVRCERIDYELQLIDEQKTDVFTMEEYIEALRQCNADTLTGPDFRKCLHSDCPRFSMRLVIRNESRLPEIRFEVAEGEGIFEDAKGIRPLLWLKPDASAVTAVSGRAILSTPVALCDGPPQIVLDVGSLIVQPDAVLLNFLSTFGASFEPLGLLGTRKPPATADPPLKPIGAKIVPSVPEGKLEKLQVARRGASPPPMIVLRVAKIGAKLPTEDRSGLVMAAIEGFGVTTGLSSDATEWCCPEHETLGSWRGVALYDHIQLDVARILAETRTSSGEQQFLLQPVNVSVHVASCIIPTQSKLPNNRVSCEIGPVLFHFAPRAVKIVHGALAKLQQAPDKPIEARQRRRIQPVGPQRIAQANIDEVVGTGGQIVPTSQPRGVAPQDSAQKSFSHGNATLLLELTNCVGCTLKLENYCCISGQLMTQIPEYVEHGDRVHWAAAQKGLLKGNVGCAVFSLALERSNQQLELLLMWSVPFVGENSAKVILQEKQGNGYYSSMQVHDLKKVLKDSVQHSHSTNAAQRADLGNVHAYSIFGKSPCKFMIIERLRIADLKIAPPTNLEKLPRGHCFFLCKLANDTMHCMHLLKCVFAKHEGECLLAADPLVPPGQHSVWTAAATRQVRNNYGCAIFSVANRAEILVQWHWSSSRIIDSKIADVGVFSKTTDHHLMMQLHDGPAAMISDTDSDTLNGIRVTHHIDKNNFVNIRVSTEKLSSLLDEDIEDVFTTTSSRDVRDDGSRTRRRTTLQEQLDDEDEKVAKERHSSFLELDKMSFENSVPLHQGLYDYNRLQLRLLLPCLQFEIVSDSSERKVSLRFDDLQAECNLHELISDVKASVDALEITDNFYEGRDAVLLTTKRISKDVRQNKNVETSQHELQDNQNHTGMMSAEAWAALDINTSIWSRLVDRENPTKAATHAVEEQVRSLSVAQLEALSQGVTTKPTRGGHILGNEPWVKHAVLVARKYTEIAAAANKFVHISASLQNHPNVSKIAVSTSSLNIAFSCLTAKFCLAVLSPPRSTDVANSEEQPKTSGAEIRKELVDSEPAKPKPHTNSPQSHANSDNVETISIVDVYTGPVTVLACSSKLIPLIQLKLEGSHCSFHQGSEAGHAATNFVLGASYHNTQVAAWEPLIETADLRAEWQMLDNSNLAALIADRPINFNFTSAAAVSLTALQVDFEQADETVDAATNYVTNKLGVPLKFSFLDDDDEESLAETQWHFVPAGIQDSTRDQAVHTTVAIPKGDSAKRKNVFETATLGVRGALSHGHVLVQICESYTDDPLLNTAWRPLKPQSLSTSGSFVHELQDQKKFTLQKSMQHGLLGHFDTNVETLHSPFVLSTIQTIKGAKYLTLESPILLSNRSDIDLVVEVCDDAMFAHDKVNLFSNTQVPIPLPMVSRNIRFQVMSADGLPVAGWSNIVKPGDATRVLKVPGPLGCTTLSVFMDKSRGKNTCNVIVHCPLALENLLPVSIIATLHPKIVVSNKKKKSGLCGARTKSSEAQHVPYVRDMQKGDCAVVSGTDVDASSDIYLHVKINAGSMEDAHQKVPVLVWNSDDVDADGASILKIKDARQRSLAVRILYKRLPGKPTQLSIYATHWIINETGLKLQYHDDHTGGIMRTPAFSENIPSEPTPFMWSFRKAKPNPIDPLATVVTHKFGISLYGKPSKVVSLNHPELCTIIEVKTPKPPAKNKIQKPRFRHVVSCYVSTGTGRYFLTKMVYLRHLLTIQNKTRHKICVRQSKALANEMQCNELARIDATEIQPGLTSPFSWAKDKHIPQYLEMMYTVQDSSEFQNPEPENPDSAEVFGTAGDGFSCPFDVQVLGDTYVRVPATENGVSMLRVQVSQVESRQFVIISEARRAPYRVENFLDVRIGYRQVDASNTKKLATGSDWAALEPFHSAPYTWDRPLKEKRLEVHIGSDGPFIFDLDTVGVKKSISKTCSAEVTLEEDILCLKILPPCAKLVAEKEYDPADVPDKLCFDMRLHSIGLSIIDNFHEKVLPRELMYVALDGIHVHQGSSDTKSVLGIVLADFQVANQLPDADNAVILCASSASRSAQASVPDATQDTDAAINLKDLVHLSVVTSVLEKAAEVTFFEYVAFCLQSLDVIIQDQFIFQLLDFSESIKGKLAQLFPEKYGERSAETIASGDDDKEGTVVAKTIPESISKVYYSKMVLHPIELIVSLQMSGDAMSSLPYAVQSLGVAFGNVDRAPLRFNCLILENAFGAASDVNSKIFEHFKMQALQELYKILGAADFLGNPVNLVSHIGSGVKDLFYLPAQGLVESPSDFVMGVGKGAESVVHHALKGVLEAAGDITGAFGKGFERMAGDSEYSSKIKKLHQKRDQSVQNGNATIAQNSALAFCEQILTTVLQVSKLLSNRWPWAFEMGLWVLFCNR